MSDIPLDCDFRWSPDNRAIFGMFSGLAIGTFAFYGIGFPLGLALARWSITAYATSQPPDSPGSRRGGPCVSCISNVFMHCRQCIISICCCHGNRRHEISATGSRHLSAVGFASGPISHTSLEDGDPSAVPLGVDGWSSNGAHSVVVDVGGINSMPSSTNTITNELHLSAYWA